MRNNTKAFKEAIRKRVTPLFATLTKGSYIISNDDIISIQIQEDLVSGDTFEIGTFQTRSATVELINKSKTGNSYGNLEGQYFDVFIGIKLTPTSSQTESSKMGHFRVVKQTNKGQTVTLEMEDASTLFDVKLDQTKITYPATLQQIAQKVCQQVKVSIASYTYNNFLNYDYVIQEDPHLDENTTCRQVIAMIAELAGGYAKMDNDGNLTFFNLEKNSIFTNFAGDPLAYIDNNIKTGVVADNLIDKNLYFSLDTSQNETSMITKVSMLVDNIFSERGNDSGKNYIIDNKLITTHENRELLKSIYEKINGLCYTTMSCDWIGDSSYEIGDNVVIYDGKRYYNTFIMHQTLNYNGGLTSSRSATGLSKEQDLTMNEGYIEQQVKRAKVSIDFMNEQIDMRVKNDDIESIVTQNAESWNLSINGKLKGTNYNFDGEGFTVTNGDITVKNADDETVMWIDDETGRLATNSLEVFGDGAGTVNLHGNGTKHIDFRSDDNKGLFINFFRGQEGSEDANPRIGIYPQDALSDRAHQLWIEPSSNKDSEPQVIVRGRNSTLEENENVQFNVFGENVTHGDLCVRHGETKYNILDMITDLEARVKALEDRLNGQ